MSAKSSALVVAFFVAWAALPAPQASAQVITVSPSASVVYRSTYRRPYRVRAYSPIVTQPLIVYPAYAAPRIVYPSALVYRPAIVYPRRSFVVYPGYSSGFSLRVRY